MALPYSELEEMGRKDLGKKNQKFSFGHVKFKILNRQPRADAKYIAGCI